MKETSIPSEVQALAKDGFCGGAKYVGEADGIKYYREAKVSSYPTGLPCLISWDGHKASWVTGYGVFDLLDRLSGS